MTTVILVVISLCLVLLQTPHVFGFKCIRETISPNEVNEGYIHSPAYPSEYPLNVCYIWYHMVSKETKVLIQIQDLDIPSLDNCRSNSSNRLLIGPHAKRQYCGTLHSDINYQADITDYFYVVFVISENFLSRGRGFLLHYKLITPGDPTTVPPGKLPDESKDHRENEIHGTSCSNTIQDSSGIITIPKSVVPSHPTNDPRGKTCSWLLETPEYLGPHHTSPMFRYTLRFQRFHLYPDCCVLDIFEGKNNKGRQIGHYTSGSHPHTLYALGPQVFFKLSYRNYANNYFGNFTVQFQREEICLSEYSPCSFNESSCYLSSKRCDGVWDCPLKGGDERGCNAVCSGTKFSCGNHSAYCFYEKDRCNGKGTCANYRDEQNCYPQQCSSDKGLFLCENKRCIYEKWRCDHTKDCEDGSDEDNCDRLSSPRLMMACVVGTLISSLLLVLALSFAFRVYTLRMRRRHGEPISGRHESPLSRIEEDLIRRRAPPPQYNEAMMTSRSYDEAYLELLNQARADGIVIDNSGSQEGSNNANNTANGTNSSAGGSAAATSGSSSSRREGGGRRENRRRGGRDRHRHRNLRSQQLQHLHGCPLLPPPPPPPPLHYFTEQPPSYSDSTATVVEGITQPSLLLTSSSENHSLHTSLAAGTELSTANGRNHELQPLTSTVVASSLLSTATTEPVPPPYCLHNDHPGCTSSGSDDDDDEDDDDIDDEEENNYTTNNFLSSSRRVVDDGDECWLVAGRQIDDDDDDEDDDDLEEEDTCLSIGEPLEIDTSSLPLSFNMTPLSSNIINNRNPPVSSVIKEDTEDDEADDDDNKNSSSSLHTRQEQNSNSQNGSSSVVDGLQKEEGTQNEELNERLGVHDVDDDDDECILNGEAAVQESDYENNDTSDTTCLLTR